MNRTPRGLSLVEVLGALAIAVAGTVGIAALVARSLEESKGQQAALHQAQVTAAASRYLRQNYDDLRGKASATSPVAVTVGQLKAAKLLPTSFMATNAYGQTACMLVLQPAAGKLEALVVTEGGPAAIPARDIAAVAAAGGPGAGFIPYETPLRASGAFGAWDLAPAAFAPYASANCSGTASGAGHLANAIFFDGDAVASDFLYRSSVEGHPELNRMTTPLHMAAVVTEGDAADPLCAAGDPATFGRIAADSAGAVMSCQAGVWKRQGSAFWKDPVPSHALLPAANNNLGDVRMATDISRAFTWNGAAWTALAVDQNGNLSVPGTASAGMVQLNTTVTNGTTCSADGLLARDSGGLLLVCAKGQWRSLLENRVTTTAYAQTFTFVPAQGDQDFFIDLASLPGPRPLFVTGFSYCQSSSDVRAMLIVEPFDAAGNRLGYAGGCGSRSSSGGGNVMVKGAVPLAKLPENAAALRVYVEPGVLAPDYAYLELYVKNSE